MHDAFTMLARVTVRVTLEASSTPCSHYC